MTATVALVTGASRGIGHAIAMELTRQGMTVIGTATSESGAASITEAIKAAGGAGWGAALDVRDAAGVDALIGEIETKTGSAITVLVNNAGITRDTLLMRMTEQMWDEVLDTNLKSAFALTKAAMRPMMKAKAGSIINITSVVGITGNAGQANYAASKAGMIGLTKSVAKELGSRNIRCNAIAPGFIETEMTEALSPEVRAEWVKGIALKRGGTPDDVANCVVFLSSDLSAYISGQTINVCGGMVM